ncbi:hypothetical protein [Arthrobacter terrae]|uniref:hypothetical protein n=1 Tax=Arthrobacter terrae TaxID=2935737 RepID=UPI001E322DF4|nr:hypothetical protein [Arthrobacter terrae]
MSKEGDEDGGGAVVDAEAVGKTFGVGLEEVRGSRGAHTERGAECVPVEGAQTRLSCGQ